MRYRKNNSPRDMIVKYAGTCACCGATIKAGEWATYYPPGTIGSRTTGAIGHIGGLEGNGQRCYVELKKQREHEYAPDVDRMYEDQCADICGR